MNLAERLRSLRKEKNVSQERLAQYLNVSFQAVSKWENANCCPDISLLPDIARFFGITIDELLQVEKIDQEKVFQDYQARACELFRSGKREQVLSLWREAYHKLPNSIEVKEMLMSACFDTDKVKYQKEILELGMEICNSEGDSYYKGQAIEQIARTCAESGDRVMAERWAAKAHLLMHAREVLRMQILEDAKDLAEQFSSANYWMFNRLCYMALGLCGGRNTPGGPGYIQAVEKAVAKLYEVVYPGDDMGFEELELMCIMHKCIAEDEIALGGREETVEYELNRALECARKSMSVEEHALPHPLVKNWHVQGAPSDNRQVVRLLKGELGRACFDGCRGMAWFMKMEQRLESLLQEEARI